MHVARCTSHANASCMVNCVWDPSFQAAGEAPRRPQAYVTIQLMSVTLRMALRPDAARIPRKRRSFWRPLEEVRDLGSAGRWMDIPRIMQGPAPWDSEWKLCLKYNNLKSSIQMHIMSSNAEHNEMTIAKLLVDSSARNQRCLEPKLYELKSIFSFLIIHELWNALKCNTKFRSKFLHGTYAAWNACNMILSNDS